MVCTCYVFPVENLTIIQKDVEKRQNGVEQKLKGSGNGKDKGQKKDNSTFDKDGPWTLVQKPKRVSKIKGFKEIKAQPGEKGN